MPRPNIYDENDNSLPYPLVMRMSGDTKQPLIRETTKKGNCCSNGSFCWYLFCCCAICDR